VRGQSPESHGCLGKLPSRSPDLTLRLGSSEQGRDNEAGRISFDKWRGGRAAECEALEKPWECKLPVGSNPTPSADQRHFLGSRTELSGEAAGHNLAFPVVAQRHPSVLDRA
jgi:hypothetical protein